MSFWEWFLIVYGILAGIEILAVMIRVGVPLIAEKIREKRRKAADE